MLRELDGLPAFHVWRDALGLPDTVTAEETASWALGVEHNSHGSDWTVLAPYNCDSELDAITFAVDVPEEAHR